MPLFHLHAISINLLATAVSGAALVCAPGAFDAPLFFRLLQGATEAKQLQGNAMAGEAAEAAEKAANGNAAEDAEKAVDGNAAETNGDGSAQADGRVEVAAADCQPPAKADAAATPTPTPTWYSAVPTIHQEVLRQAEQAAEHGPPLVHTLGLVRNCSAALAPSVAARLEAAMGVTVLTTYAMTEALPIW